MTNGDSPKPNLESVAVVALAAHSFARPLSFEIIRRSTSLILFSSPLATLPKIATEEILLSLKDCLRVETRALNVFVSAILALELLAAWTRTYVVVCRLKSKLPDDGENNTESSSITHQELLLMAQAVVTVTKKGQATIPKKMRERHGIGRKALVEDTEE